MRMKFAILDQLRRQAVPEELEQARRVEREGEAVVDAARQDGADKKKKNRKVDEGSA